jgi:hypothetical protein
MSHRTRPKHLIIPSTDRARHPFHQSSWSCLLDRALQHRLSPHRVHQERLLECRRIALGQAS